MPENKKDQERYAALAARAEADEYTPIEQLSDLDVTASTTPEELDLLLQEIVEIPTGGNSGKRLSAQAILDLTAMDLVHAAQRGAIDHDTLVRLLEVWPFEPQYRTSGEADDWESVPNSFDAVEFAYVSEIITDADYDDIVDAQPDCASAERRSKRPI